MLLTIVPLKRTSANRCHHLLKTFFTGAGGWADCQMPDAAVVWRSPSGQMYTTAPGGAFLFPTLAAPTGKLQIPESNGPQPAHRGLMMPVRRRTRAEDRAYRIASERQHNAERLARRHLLLADRIARDDEPPPF